METTTAGLGFFGAMKPLYYVSKPFGLAPFTVDCQSDKFSSSRYERRYSIFVLALEVILTAFLMIQRLRSQHMTATVQMTEIIEVLLVTSSSILTLAQMCFSRHIHITRILNKCIEMDRAILTNPTEEHKEIFRHILVQVLSVFPMLLCTFIAEGIFWQSTIKAYALYYGIVHPFYVVTAVIIVQFFNLVILVKRRFSVVNRRLRAVWQRKRKTGVLDHPLVIPQGDTTIGGLQQCTPSHRKEGTEEAEEVRILRELYDRLCDITTLINSAYGLPILTCMATNFVHAITCLNFALTIILKLQGPAHVDMDGLAALSVFWALMHSAGILAVTWSCSALTSESLLTAELVHKALLPPQRGATGDAELRRQLQMFSQQLLHRRPGITACGLFVVDLSNVSSVVAAIVSYLVVIVQLSAAQNSSKEG